MESTERALCGPPLREIDLRAITGLAPGAGRLKCFGDGLASTADDVGAESFICRLCDVGDRGLYICEGGGGACAFGSAQGGTAESLEESSRDRHIAVPCGVSPGLTSIMPLPHTFPGTTRRTFLFGVGEPSRELGAEVW